MKEIINKLSKNIAYYSFGLFIILYSFCNIFFTAKQYGISRINVCYFGIDVLHIVMVFLLFIAIIFVLKTNLSRKSNVMFLVFLVDIFYGWIILDKNKSPCIN